MFPGIPNDAIYKLLLFAPPFILCLSFHEFAHAWVAHRLGDSTARHLGRLTMDPMAHISLMGTVIFPAVAILTGGPLFGWANPVPVDMRNFRKPRVGMALVAAAGPVSNVLLSFVCAALLSGLLSVAQRGFLGAATPSWFKPATEMLLIAIQLNLFLAFFNLIPIPPLDGSRIVQGLVNERIASDIDRIAPQAQIVLFILFVTGMLNFLARPVNTMYGEVLRIFGIF